MEKLTTVRGIFKDKESFADKEVKVGGWVKSIRDSKDFGFIVLSDGTYFEPIQVVYHSELPNFEKIEKLNISACIIVTGKLILTPDAKQPFEIQATDIAIEGESTPDYPLQKKRHTMEYLRTKNQYLPGGLQGKKPRGLRYTQIFPGERFCLCSHSSHYRKRR